MHYNCLTPHPNKIPFSLKLKCSYVFDKDQTNSS